jgi:hypothetical protein
MVVFSPAIIVATILELRMEIAASFKDILPD